jgi:hypothetical protein
LNVRRLESDLGELFTRGAVAGIAAGFIFLLANMGYATTQGKPSLAPFMDISTIFHGTDKPASMTPTVDMLATGAVVHIVVNFQIFGNTIFEWFTNPQGPNQGFEVFIHAVFGLMLVPFFIRLARRLRTSI